MKTASFYDLQGRVVGVMTGPQECVIATSQHNQHSWIEGAANPDTQYVVDGVLTLRPDNPAMLEGHVLRGLPAPCFIKIADSAYACNDTVAELSFEHAGTFQVTVEAWPYLNKEFTVENPPL